MVGGKLPNVAALQAEYAALGEQKEKLYADYGRLKKQVKEYDVIKRNIDSILRRESEPERGKENVRRDKCGLCGNLRKSMGMIKLSQCRTAERYPYFYETEVRL